ncbi:MAG: MlaD family protein [Negativicutes bacterium]
MGYSKEAKVGLVFIVGVALFIVMASFLGAFKSSDKGYEFTATYRDVSGLYSGASIHFAGVTIGRVTTIKLTQDIVEVGLFIKEQYQIPEGSSITIATSGVLGDKYIDISAPQKPNGKFIQPGAYLIGKPSQMAAMLESAAEIMAGVQQMVKAVNTSLLGPEQQASYRRIISSAGETADNVKLLTANTNKILVANHANIEIMMLNLRQMSQTLNDFSQKANRFITVFNKDDIAATDMRDTIANVKDSTARLDKILTALEPTLTDPQTAEDIKQTAKNARVLSDTSVDLLKNNKLEFHGGGEMMAGAFNGSIQTSAWATMDINKTSFGLLGFDNIGGTTSTNSTTNAGGLNLQYGIHSTDGRSYRVGLVDSQPGIGVDMNFNENLWKLSLDLYNPNDLSIKARIDVALTDNIYAVLQNYRINQSPKDIYLGIGAKF